MPTYEFKCGMCGKNTEVLISISQFNYPHNTILGECSNKKCKNALYRENQQINFAGTINMNASEMGISQRKFNNKSGGPVGLSGGKPVGRAKV